MFLSFSMSAPVLEAPMFGICRSNPCSAFSGFGSSRGAAVQPATSLSGNGILGTGCARAGFRAASSRFSCGFFYRVMFIHKFCRLQEGVNPISPDTKACEADVTYMRYLRYLGV